LIKLPSGSFQKGILMRVLPNILFGLLLKCFKLMAHGYGYGNWQITGSLGKIIVPWVCRNYLSMR